MKDARLTHLLDRYLEGGMTESEMLELERTLKGGAEARRFFWEYTSLHALSHEAAKLKWSEQSELVGRKAPVGSKETVKSGGGVASWWSGWRWTWARGMAVGLGLVLVMVALFQGWRQYRTVAVLARAVDVEWDGAVSTAEGSALRSEWLRLKRGAVLVEFKKGARVVFEAPAELRLDSPDAAFCRVGRFTVLVPERARGFTLQTEEFDVVDLGTEFGLSKPPVGRPEVHVFAGRVELDRGIPAVPSLGLSQGEAARWESNAWTRLPASHAGFISEADSFRRSLDEVRVRQRLWEEAGRALDADPNMLLHYTFQEEASWDRVLTNQAAGSLDASHGNIQGCEWTEGRWPGKKALAFENPEDRVRLQLSQSFTSVTCLIWVRVDQLTNGFVHSLLTGDSEAPGTMRWTLSQQGQVRFGVARESSGPEAAWGVGISPVVVTNERLGNWLMIATVYDGQKVAHYLDGRWLGSSSVPSPGALSFGWVELGNWAATPEHPDFQWAKARNRTFFDRHFTGRIDEVAVLSRVMTAEEIQGYYDAGRPVEVHAMAANLFQPPISW